MARRSAKIIPMPIRRQLVCSACGAGGEGTCGCNAPYVPAGERAAEAVAANPAKGDRAIAADIGVDHKTVAKARKAGGEYSPPEKRIGKDGKAYPAKGKATKAKKRKPADTSTGTIHQQVTALYKELKNFSNDYCARLAQWIETHDFDEDCKIGLMEVLEDTAMSLQRLAQAVDGR